MCGTFAQAGTAAVMTAAMAIRHDPRIADQIRPEIKPWITSVMVNSPSVRPRFLQTLAL